MTNNPHDIDESPVATWWHWCSVILGLTAITMLLWIFVSTLNEHMSKAREMSRDTQWHVNAPVAGAQAAVLLQGGEP